MWIRFIFVIEQLTKALAYNAEYSYFCKVGVRNHSSRHSRTRGISLSFIWRSGKFLNWYKDKSKCLSSHVYYYQDNIWVRHGLFLFISRLLPEPPNEINYSFHAFFLCNYLLETEGMLCNYDRSYQPTQSKDEPKHINIFNINACHWCGRIFSFMYPILLFFNSRNNFNNIPWVLSLCLHPELHEK